MKWSVGWQEPDGTIWDPFGPASSNFPNGDVAFDDLLENAVDREEDGTFPNFTTAAAHHWLTEHSTRPALQLYALRIGKIPAPVLRCAVDWGPANNEPTAHARWVFVVRRRIFVAQFTLNKMVPYLRSGSVDDATLYRIHTGKWGGRFCYRMLVRTV